MEALGFTRANISRDKGLNLKPGDNHYRAYVGPPQDYDLVSAMVFNLLTCLGLRQHHKLIDIGCGSLRIGRLLIPYLNEGNYIGVEPNKWLINDGILNEIGKDQVEIKKPTFIYSETLSGMKEPLHADFAIAQSIFSHCSKQLIDKWLSEISQHLKPMGVLFATFLPDEKDFEGEGWIYPGCVKYKPHTMETLALKYDLKFKMLDWHHPRQKWAALYKNEYNTRLLDFQNIRWNNLFAK